jgi:putative adhesin
MKRNLLVLIGIALVAGTAAASTLEEKFDRAFDVRPGQLFALTNTNGHITIHAWDQPRVQVHALKRVEGRDADAMKKAMAALKIEPSLGADGLRINTVYPKNNGGGFFDWLAGSNVSAGVEYEVTVPRSMNLTIDNTNGAIEISDVRGSHHIENTNGHIELSRCGGDVDAETTNGAIKAELTEVTPGKSMRLESTNGRITVTLPKSVAMRVDAATTNGSVNTELPVTTTEMRDHALRGTINGGGNAELHLRTTNGSINIEAR